MTEATATAVQMPERWDLVGEYDGYMSPIEEGDYVKVEDVEPLVAEINRLRAQVAKARAIVEYMNEDDPVSVAWSDLYDLRDVLKG